MAVIDSHAVAGTIVSGNQILHSIAMIANDGSIYIATGEMEDDALNLDASKNKKQTIEINEDGTLEL